MPSAKDLNWCADLSEGSLANAIGDLFKLELFDDKEPQILTVVCNPYGAAEAKRAVEAQNDVTSNLAFQLRFADYLGTDAWFVTDGERLVFCPGA